MVNVHDIDNPDDQEVKRGGNCPDTCILFRVIILLTANSFVNHAC